MRNIPLRIGKHFRPRFPVPTPRAHNVPHFLHPAKQLALYDILEGSTTKSLRTLLQALRSRTLISRVVTLSQFGLTVDEYRLWKGVLFTPDFSEAISMIEKKCFRVRMPRPEECKTSTVAEPLMPAWVLLSIVCYAVANSKDAATKMEELVFSYLPDVPSGIQGPLLLAAASHFGHLNFLVPLRRTVQAFLYVDLEDPALQFNQMLKAITRISNKSIEGADLVIQLLHAMRSRQLRLYSSTYDALLKDRFVTLQLTKKLRQEMIDSGHTPTAEQLEAYLRFFAKDGAIHDAGKYYEAIQREFGSQSRAEPSPSRDNPIHRANTLFLRGQSDRASAFHFLRNLSEKKKSNISSTLIIPKTLSDSAGKRQKYSVSPSSKLESHALKPNVSGLGQSRKHRRAHVAVPHPSHNKPMADAYDYSAAFLITARDTSISVKRLVALFNSMPIRPTIVTYTVLLTGLLHRGEFKRAEIYWHKLVASGLSIDAPALSSGLTILTRLNKVHAAFDTLQAFVGYAKKGHMAMSLRAAGSITTAVINNLMVALNRVGRPDVVFRLWDYMEHLYNVQPDSTTLSIVLRSTRLACKLDDSLSGALARLSLKLPFRKASSLHNLTHLEMSQSITVAIGPQKAESKYRSGLWDQMLPLEAARLNFHRVIFSNARYDDLVDVEMPTAAVHTLNEDRMLSFSIGLPKISPIKPQFFNKRLLYQPSGQSYFPQIAITDTNFIEYITLIGINGLASEIPLTLAWMRMLGLHPSTATLALALVFWSEVSLHAPLIVSWVGGPAGDNHTKLVMWLRDWVGEILLPSPTELLKWQRIVNEMKNT